MRNRRGLNKIGMLAMAMVLALGAMGVAYGAWIDEVTITGSLSTSSINASLTCDSCWEEPVTDGTYISCSEGAPMTLNLHVEDALEGVDYYCTFIVSNATGSLPIKIAAMDITDSYDGVTEVIELLPVGTVIDPGNSVTGQVHIYLTTDDSAGEDIDVALQVSVVRWNE